MVSEERYKQIKEKCEEKGYELITKQNEIMNNQSLVTYICPIHGEYTTRVTSIMQGKSCYKCSRNNALTKAWQKRKGNYHDNTYEKLLNACKQNSYEPLFDDESDLRYHSYVKYICPKHGVKQIRVGNLINGKRCNECNIEYKHELFKFTPDEVVDRIENLGSKIYNPEEYINQDIKNLIVSCPRCGSKFTTSLKHFLQHGGQQCSGCYRKESIGELRIRHYLEDHDIKFDSEKMFDDCRDNGMLRFDFYLPDMDIAIEFDGEQHFIDNHYFNYDFNKNRLHDEIKTQYCIDHGIKLIRIPYKKLDYINDILEKEIA